MVWNEKKRRMIEEKFLFFVRYFFLILGLSIMIIAIIEPSMESNQDFSSGLILLIFSLCFDSIRDNIILKKQIKSFTGGKKL